MLVSDRQSVENVPVISPLGHEVVHTFYEQMVMRRFEQVGHFVHQDVFQALPWFLGQLGVQSDRSRCVIATAPLGLHGLNENAFHLDTH